MAVHLPFVPECVFLTTSGARGGGVLGVWLGGGMLGVRLLPRSGSCALRCCSLRLHFGLGICARLLCLGAFHLVVFSSHLPQLLLGKLILSGNSNRFYES